jgi:hypothetical protein
VGKQLHRIEVAKMDSEQWKPVVGFDGFYEVSDLGRVRSVDRVSTQRESHGLMVTRRLTGRLLRQKTRRDNGYCEVTLKAIGLGIKSRVCLVHRLVLEAFVGPCPSGQQARHFPDRNCTNNRLANLAWGTPLENQADRIIHGTTVNGEKSHLSKLSAIAVQEIRKRLANGDRIRDVAREYKMNEATIGHIKAGRSWRATA